MRTTTEEAADIRAQYKALGWSSRDVSVRADYFSMGSSIRVLVKSVKVDPHKARAIAEGRERIDRCEYTGEILSGGNRYVHVDYSPEYSEILARRFIAQVEAAAALLATESDSALVIIEGTDGRGFLSHGQWRGCGMQLWLDDDIRRQYNAGSLQTVAFEVALRMLLPAKGGA